MEEEYDALLAEIKAKANAEVAQVVTTGKLLPTPAAPDRSRCSQGSHRTATTMRLSYPRRSSTSLRPATSRLRTSMKKSRA